MFFHENSDSSVFINPFGPTIYHNKIDENTINDIKNSIDEQLEYFEGNNKKQLLADTGSTAINDESIRQGKIFGVDFQLQQAFHDDVVRNVVKEHSKKYYENYSQVIESNITEDKNKFYFDYLPEKLHKYKRQQLEYEKAKSKPFCISAWCSITKLNDYFQSQSHFLRQTLFTGLICVDSENFEYPNGIVTFINNSSKGQFSSGSFYIQPKKGDIYIWPSWLTYSINQTNSEVNRLLIHFNSSCGVSYDSSPK